VINFRSMKLGDLDSIYQDKELRPLITVNPKGQKFAVVIEEDGQILGGATGYVENNSALLQCIIIKNLEQKRLYKDGLVRSLLHFLELDGLRYLFIKEDDPLYLDIGFEKFQIENMRAHTVGYMKEDLINGSLLWIDIEKFFNGNTCQSKNFYNKQE
jgi:hypothetical protein